MCQVWKSSRHNIKPTNSLLTGFYEVLNPLPYFKIGYYDIIDILYILIKECHFSETGLLDILAFYEVLSIVDKFKEEIEARNKQQEEDNKNNNETIEINIKTLDHIIFLFMFCYLLYYY